MPAALNLKGQTFGMLTVLSERGRDRHGQVKWACKCECGNRHVVVAKHLRSGNTKSCGCYKTITARQNLARARA